MKILLLAIFCALLLIFLSTDSQVISDLPLLGKNGAIIHSIVLLLIVGFIFAVFKQIKKINQQGLNAFFNRTSLVVVIFLAVCILAYNFLILPNMEESGELIHQQLTGGGQAGVGGGGVDGEPVDDGFIGQVRSKTSMIVASILVGLAVLIIIVLVVNFLLKTKKQNAKYLRSSIDEEDTTEPLSLSDLDEDITQESYKNVVIDIYAILMNVVKIDKGISITTSTSPSEFAVKLISLGFDKTSITEITEAFEQIRYGHLTISNQRIARLKTALSVLTENQGENNGNR